MTSFNSAVLRTVASIAVALLIGACSKQSNIESHLQKAKAFMEAEDYSAAEIELKNVLRDDNRNTEALLTMGRLYFKQGRFRDAFPYLNTGKELSPNNLENRKNLASLLMIAGRPDLAQEEAVFILSIDPKDDQAPLIISDSVRTPEAIPQALQILSQLPITPASLTANAFLDLKRKAFFPAFAKIGNALKQDPEFGPAYTGQFAVNMSLGKLEEATESLRKAAEFSPKRSGLQTSYADHLANQLGDIDGAIAHLESVAKDAPDFVPVISRLSELYMQANRVDEAKELNKRTLKLDPLDPIGLRIKGMLAASGERFDEAITILTGMLELYPQDIKANYQLGLAYIAKGQNAKAIPPLEFVNLRNPGNFEASLLLANAQSNEKDISGSVITLKRLVANRPDSAEAKILLAAAYNRLENYDAALELYNQVNSNTPENPQLDYLSGITQLRRDNRLAARQSFESALENNPLHLQSVEQLTALDLSERSYNAALQRINNSIELAAETPILHVIKAQILNAMGSSQEAEASYLHAIDLEPENSTAHILLSRLYLSQDRTDEALAHLNTVLKSNPKDITTLTTLASVYENEKDMAKAIENYEKILTFAPRNLTALNNLAYLISIEDGATDRALDFAEKARAEAPTNPYTADTLGWILFQRGEYARARALLQNSYSLLPENAEVNYHLGAANYYLGNLTEARSRLEKATQTAGEYAGYQDALSKIDILSINPQTINENEIEILTKAAENERNKDPVALVKLGLAAKSSKDAITRFRSAIKAVPENIYARLELALELSKTGQSNEALELAKAVAKQEPNNPEVTYNQGKIVYQTGDYAWAASLLSQAVRQLPRNADAHFILANALLATGKLTDAIEAAEKAVPLFVADSQKERAQTFVRALHFIQNPQSHFATNGLLPDTLILSLVTAMNATLGDNKSNAAPWEEILKKYPDQAQSKLELAKHLAESGSSPQRTYELASDCRRVIGNTPTVTAIQGIAKYQLGQFEQSAQFFSQIDPSFQMKAIWLYYRGMAAKETGKKELATQSLQEAIEAGIPSSEQEKAKSALQALRS